MCFPDEEPEPLMLASPAGLLAMLLAFLLGMLVSFAIMCICRNARFACACLRRRTLPEQAVRVDVAVAEPDAAVLVDHRLVAAARAGNFRPA
jgi:hypothetical protein